MRDIFTMGDWAIGLRKRPGCGLMAYCESLCKLGVERAPIDRFLAILWDGRKDVDPVAENLKSRELHPYYRRR